MGKIRYNTKENEFKNGKNMKKILINESPWQIRIAITNEELLQNIYFTGHRKPFRTMPFLKALLLKFYPESKPLLWILVKKKQGFLHISEIDRDLAIEKISKHTQIDDEEEQLHALAVRSLILVRSSKKAIKSWCK